MTHVFMDLDVKESAKSVFGYTAVPFYVIIDKVRVYYCILSQHSHAHRHR